jgi:hypothetical protein
MKTSNVEGFLTRVAIRVFREAVSYSNETNVGSKKYINRVIIAKMRHLINVYVDKVRKHNKFFVYDSLVTTAVICWIVAKVHGIRYLMSPQNIVFLFNKVVRQLLDGIVFVLSKNELITSEVVFLKIVDWRIPIAEF